MQEDKRFREIDILLISNILYIISYILYIIYYILYLIPYTI